MLQIKIVVELQRPHLVSLRHSHSQLERAAQLSAKKGKEVAQACTSPLPLPLHNLYKFSVV